MESRHVVVREIRFLRGPNLYARMPVMRVTLDIGSYEERPSNSFSGLVDRLVAWLPALREHRCSLGRSGGFVRRLRQGTYLAHICEHVCIELQRLVGFDVGFGRARGAGEPGLYTVVVAYQEEEPARAAFQTAIRLVLAAMHDEPFDPRGELDRLRELADEHRLGPSTAAIVAAARARHIPTLRLTPASSLVQLGHGVHQKRIQAAQTNYTSALAVELCQDKPLTNRLLRQVGVPVPEGRAAASPEEAWDVARELGLPVVVKPRDGNQGKGVSVNLAGREEVRAAFAVAERYGEVLIERYVEGEDYRLLVVGGKMVAAARRDAPTVVGDGRCTISQLIEEMNRDPRRRDGHSGVLSRVRPDEAVRMTLSRQGLSLVSVPEPGRLVQLRHNCNLSTGGTATDVTEEVHPRNARLAELAARALGLDVAGVDLLCKDIRSPVDEQGGAIVEVNACPGLRLHLYPSGGQPRDVAAPIVELLYPPGAPSRIPILAVTGTNGKTTVVRLIAHIYEAAGYAVGMTCTEGVFVQGERIVRGDCSGPNSARTVLLHPRVEAAVLETARGGILREGLGFDRCTVGVVTNVAGDHLGLEGIHTLEELAWAKQVVVEAVDREGFAVLNADDPLVAKMAGASDGQVVYFSSSPDNPVVTAHLERGGRCVFAESGAMVLAEKELRTDLVELARLPFAGRGKIRFQLQNALAAAAAAWASGLKPATIARALSTFRAEAATLPGRFNVMKLNDLEVVVDYGHNAAALMALGQAVEALGRRRTVLSIGLPGDRRDEDLAAAIEATASYIHEYVIYDPRDRRGRAPAEMYRLLESRLPRGVPRGYAAGQREGILAAWRRTRPGDRLIVIADEVDEAIELIESLPRDGERALPAAA